jgi:hypothetical protein
VEDILMQENQLITTIEGLSGMEIERLYKAGSLDHLRDQKISSKQIMEMHSVNIIKMMKKGIIYSEPVPV